MFAPQTPERKYGEYEKNIYMYMNMCKYILVHIFEASFELHIYTLYIHILVDTCLS